jgi:3-deoxy-7-phosphoheptulonate synthase
MIIVMKRRASKKEINSISSKIESTGFTAHIIHGEERTVIGAIGTGDKERIKMLVNHDGVDRVYPISKPYKLAARSSKEEDTLIHVDDIQIGGGTFVVFAGPCAVESREQLFTAADGVKEGGAHFVRGGAFKPRTSPYSFQGMGEDGLKLLQEVKQRTGLPVITELMSIDTVDMVSKYTDIIQIGARNMQNFSLLKQLGRTKCPIFLKRGLCATLEELLMSAEYIMSEGNYNVMLCERGIRTYEKSYRNTLDLNAIPTLKKLTHLPIIVDPAHGTGRVDLVPPMAKAAIAAGADGIMVEVHPKPEEAFSDGQQSLTIPQFKQMMEELKPFIAAAGKKLIVL